MPTPDTNLQDKCSPDAAAKAALNPAYAIRMLVFGLLFAGFSGWSLFDGWVRYPEQNRRAAQYKEFMDGHRAGDWPAYARTQGWPVTRPGPGHTIWDIRTQFLMAGVFGAIGGLVLVALALKQRCCFVADAGGLQGFRRAPVPYSAIREIDRRDWDRKGIARLICELETGRLCLTLDDWKFSGMEAILKRIEEERPDLTRPAPPLASSGGG